MWRLRGRTSPEALQQLAIWNIFIDLNWQKSSAGAGQRFSSVQAAWSGGLTTYITCCHGAQVVFACMRPRMDNAEATWSVRRPMCRACRHCSSSLGSKSASISRRMDRRSRSMFCIGLPAAQQPVIAGAWACRTGQGGRQCWRMDTPRASSDNNPFSSGAWAHRTHPGADSETPL